VWRKKKETGFVDFKMTCILQAGKKKMGLIPVSMMKWMEILNIFLRGFDRLEVNPMGLLEFNLSPLQKMKGVLNIEGDHVDSHLEFSPLFLPCLRS
jgi:hypothetical protein